MMTNIEITMLGMFPKPRLAAGDAAAWGAAVSGALVELTCLYSLTAGGMAR
jgi:hypothetical protein